ncbi:MULTISPECIES: ABC transporter ATP-binding protein [unclassified Treponema]|uniref:ABC transporter ATP-binding protein n=1 Tax=unclassified Treponema TaxID=2638727 RepID=UPI0020A419B5|nr:MULTISPECIES: ABC transporter ATP-binding protein [unclassified Treponema]UTC66824.1 ABC transporter ATP-binding protein [Treponema sp. OMZ 789]UTC69556.1 ABC transporter ATP-binding protein [Treponema sp. OMZ 790]UTC72269.1 ABC transporter ATP-binding protein [Treponema sp. OMZ 791]
MYKELFACLSKKGKIDVCISSLFFTLYGLSSVGMLLTVFSILFKINEGTQVEGLYVDFAVLIGLVIFKGLCNMIADLKKHGAGFDVVQQIRERMIVKLKLFSLGFYTNERLGELNTILHKDVDNMSMVVGHMWPRMFGDFLIALAVFTGLALINLKFALIMAASLPLALFYLFYTIKKAQKIESRNNSALADMVSLFVEYVRGIPVLKSFSHNKSLDNELFEKTKTFGETSKTSSRFKARQLSVFSFLIDAGYFVLLVYSGRAALKGSINVLDFMIIAVVSKEFYKPFAAMETHYMYYVSAVDSYHRLGKILHAEVIADKTDGIIPLQNDIVFEDVEFSYEEDEFKMEKVSFTVPEKTMTALAGESGSGKTTITNLLLRFYDVQAGSIKIGGADIRDIPYDELLDRIGIVMQNVQLFDNTIEENIRVGKKGASKEEIIEACKKARIHDFIMSLPDNYATDIGENGGLLSGGQRQRISIARAFLKDAPILILDEMTSNVDPVNESLIQEAITELSKNRTVLVIAHHLKTIQKADQILVFRKGSLVEKGKHDELLKNGTYYKRLWKAQCGSGR